MEGGEGGTSTIKPEVEDCQGDTLVKLFHRTAAQAVRVLCETFLYQIVIGLPHNLILI